jgi:uroporphyrinogen-III decarboxylase
MRSKERLLKTIKGEKTDRVPISTCEMVGYDLWPEEKIRAFSYEVLGFDYKNWYRKHKSYLELMDYIKEYTDCIYIWYPDENGGVGKILTGAEVEIETTVFKKEISTYSKVTIKTPKGPLSMGTRVDDNVNTIWETEHLLKDENDVEKMLSIPYVPYRPDISSYKIIEDRLDENGVMLPNIGDPLLYVAEMFGFTNFTVLSYTNKKMIIKLLDILYERVYEYLEYLLINGVKGIYRIVGPEYATPPYLPPDFFKEFVVKYDTVLTGLIHKYGALVRLHSHGRVGKVMEYIEEIGVDALDPVEAPPSGDILLKDAKKRIGDRICLMGNIQVRDMELMSENEVEELVKRTIDDGAPDGRFVLMTTASPINAPIAEQTKRNYYTLIDTALKYGRY